MFRAAFNWLFRPARAAAPPAQVTTAAHDSGDLGSRLSRLESQMTTVMLQWTETLDKLQAWTNRQNARDAKRAQLGLMRLAEAPETHEDAPGTANAAAPVSDMAEIKKQLRRRLQAQNGR